MSQPGRPYLGIRRGDFLWLWTLFAAALIVLVPFLLSHKSALLFPADSDEDKHRLAFEFLLHPLSAVEASSIFSLETAFLTPLSLWRPEAIDGAKSLLSSEGIALLDALQPATLPLKQAVKINLGSLTVAENGTSPKNAKQKQAGMASRLARVTVYWPQEGDFYTKNRRSSSGIRLRDGHCAVDPNVIPYGSVVNVPGVGRLVAVDTGRAVISRRAAKLAGQTRDQRRAIVIDVFCSTRAKARALIKRIKHFAVVTWQRPDQVAEL